MRDAHAARKVDGVAIMTSEMDARLITEFQSREIPLVFLDTGKAEALTSNIVVDYAAGVDAAVEHIVSLGHTKIAFISGPMMLRLARVRREAFAGCLERRGIGTIDGEATTRWTADTRRWRGCWSGRSGRRRCWRRTI